MSTTAVPRVAGTPSHWGLVRCRWVLTKFVLTMGATTASLLALRPGLHEAAVQAAPAGAGSRNFRN
jgi:hypothetical protein